MINIYMSYMYVCAIVIWANPKTIRWAKEMGFQDSKRLQTKCK